MKHLKFMLWVLVALVIVILIVQNHEAMSTPVVFKADFRIFQFRSPETSLYLIVTSAFLFGVIIAGLYGMIERFQLKRQIKTLINDSRDKDKELNSLRNLPITSDDVGAGQIQRPFEEAEKGDI